MKFVSFLFMFALFQGIFTADSDDITLCNKSAGADETAGKTKCNEITSKFSGDKTFKCCWVKYTPDNGAVKYDCVRIKNTEDALKAYKTELDKTASGIDVQCSSQTLMASLVVFLTFLLI